MRSQRGFRIYVSQTCAAGFSDSKSQVSISAIDPKIERFNSCMAGLLRFSDCSISIRVRRRIWMSSEVRATSPMMPETVRE